MSVIYETELYLCWCIYTANGVYQVFRKYQNQRSESWGHRVQYRVLSLKLQGEGSEGQTCRQRLLPDQGAPKSGSQDLLQQKEKSSECVEEPKWDL